MPPRYVGTIREELQYEYAKLMSRTVFHEQLNYGFITDRFKALRGGTITISGTNREWEKEAELPRSCVFCGADKDLQRDHLIPSSRGGSDDADNVRRQLKVDR
jgi:5-methylcytosine-specific restriction endonuclease McrA